jgi:hypothetical protein
MIDRIHCMPTALAHRRPTRTSQTPSASVRLLVAGAACLAFLATSSSTAHAGLPACASDESCGDGGDVCVGLDGGWEGGPFCSVPPVLLDAAAEAGEVVVCGPGNGADSEGNCLTPSRCTGEIGAYACPMGTVCCRASACFAGGHVCEDSSECCDGMTCSGPTGQEGVRECGGNDLGGTDDAGSTGPTTGIGHDAGASGGAGGSDGP